MTVLTKTADLLFIAVKHRHAVHHGQGSIVIVSAVVQQHGHSSTQHTGISSASQRALVPGFGAFWHLVLGSFTPLLGTTSTPILGH